MGHSWLDEADDVQDRIEYVAETATNVGMPLGGVATRTDGAQAAIDDGYQLVLVGGEISSARRILGEKLAALR